MDWAGALPNSMAIRASLDFAGLMREHQGMVFSLAYHFLCDRMRAEDLAQDVFLQLYKHLHELESDEHAVFWLRKVTAQRCIDEARRRKRRQELPLDDVHPPAAQPNEGDAFLHEHLRRLLASLPEQARMIVVLRYQEDLGPAEIANVLGMQVNTVKSQLHRALEMLRTKAAQLQLER
jgi:RNA polymerase sigma-70 factor (ECF subfamily)